MRTVLAAIAAAAISMGSSAAMEAREAEALSCLPTNGYVQLPGIAYDDMTPLARETFRSNPAAVTNALYALPYGEREDFISLYLEPKARERHRYFFARCLEAANRRAMAARVDGGEVIPAPLLDELRERERVRLALHDGAIPFQLDGRLVSIPVPAGYAAEDGALAGYMRDAGLAESLAAFGKTRDGATDPRHILATVKHVRAGGDRLQTMVAAYRIMVDDDWRLVAMHPAGAKLDEAETLEYRWNLAPFQVGETSFCYGQFEKTRDFHGTDQLRYRATAVVMLDGVFIQVGISHPGNTDLDTVNEINTDLLRWRDAILAANM